MNIVYCTFAHKPVQKSGLNLLTLALPAESCSVLCAEISPILHLCKSFIKFLGFRFDSIFTALEHGGVENAFIRVADVSLPTIALVLPWHCKLCIMKAFNLIKYHHWASGVSMSMTSNEGIFITPIFSFFSSSWSRTKLTNSSFDELLKQIKIDPSYILYYIRKLIL